MKTGRINSCWLDFSDLSDDGSDNIAVIKNDSVLPLKACYSRKQNFNKLNEQFATYSGK